MNAPAELERELPMQQMDSNMAGMITRQEIDMQIATAMKYPRTIKQFKDTALALATLSEQTAQECIYALPRDGKVIEGPSARFAEIIVYSWKHCRAGARVVDESGEFVTSQGVFMDLQQNNGISYEVRRRITNKRGQKFSADMIGVTANAASSIALRNAVLKGIPKAIWNPIYHAARHTIMGDFKTLTNRREDAIQQFVAYGVNIEMILSVLGLKGKEDIGLEQLVVLRGILTAIQDGDTTPEQAFAQSADDKPRVEMPRAKSQAPAPTEQTESAPPPSQPSHAQTDTGTPEGAGNAPGNEGGDNAASKPASPGMILNIRSKLKGLAAVLGQTDEAEILAECLANHEIKTLDGINVEQGNKILAWIKTKQPK